MLLLPLWGSPLKLTVSGALAWRCTKSVSTCGHSGLLAGPSQDLSGFKHLKCQIKAAASCSTRKKESASERKSAGHKACAQQVVCKAPRRRAEPLALQQSPRAEA